MVSDMLFDFRDYTSWEAWRSVDDRVMGGQSGSTLILSDDGTALFRGVVILEGGGFASVRTSPGEYDLSAYDGLSLRVRGDGKRYAFNIRTAEGHDSLRYEARFTTKADQWQTVDLPWSAFGAKIFGNERPTAPSLDPSQIESFGFLISDEQGGPFSLEIDWIKAVERFDH